MPQCSLIKERFLSRDRSNKNGGNSETLNDGSEIIVPSSEVVQQYDKHMAGIDCSDQLRSIYGMAR